MKTFILSALLVLLLLLQTCIIDESLVPPEDAADNQQYTISSDTFSIAEGNLSDGITVKTDIQT